MGKSKHNVQKPMQLTETWSLIVLYNKETKQTPLIMASSIRLSSNRSEVLSQSKCENNLTYYVKRDKHECTSAKRLWQKKNKLFNSNAVKTKNLLFRRQQLVAGVRTSGSFTRNKIAIEEENTQLILLCLWFWFYFVIWYFGLDSKKSFLPVLHPLSVLRVQAIFFHMLCKRLKYGLPVKLANFPVINGTNDKYMIITDLKWMKKIVDSRFTG